MGKVTLASIIILCAACMVAGCVIALPPSSRVYKTENNVKDLLNNGASRDSVIRRLGRPTTKDETMLMYRRCQGGSVIYWAILNPVHLEPDHPYRGAIKCYKFILHFDDNDKLSSYEKQRWSYETSSTDNEKTSDNKTLPIIRSMAENGFPESQWRLYDEYGRKPEDAIWLCRSADNGYAKAQLNVGNLYWSAADISQNRIKAYVWYKLAATGDMLKGLLPDVETQNEAALAMRDAEKYLTPEQLAETDMFYIVWEKGQCEHELMPELLIND